MEADMKLPKDFLAARDEWPQDKVGPCSQFEAAASSSCPFAELPCGPLRREVSCVFGGCLLRLLCCVCLPKRCVFVCA